MEGAAHSALREQYRTLPRVTGLGAQLDGSEIEEPHSFPEQRRLGLVNSLTVVPDPTVRKLMEHDVIVAMHHRLMNAHHGYRLGVEGEPGQYGSVLEDELSGMARYSGSPRLQQRFPWPARKPGSPSPPEEDEINVYHGTPEEWSGPVDPQKTRMRLAHQGGAGFYATDQPDVTDAYRGTGDFRSGVTYRYRAPIMGMSMHELGGDEAEIEPYRKRRIHRWMRDMASRYLGPDVSLGLEVSRKNVPYTTDMFRWDLSTLSRHLYPKLYDGSGWGMQQRRAYLSSNMEAHLLTMALTAAGYHGTVSTKDVGFGEDPVPTHDQYSFFPVSWALLRRTAEVPAQHSLAFHAYDDIASLDPLLRRVRTIRARQPRARGATERISRTNPWQSA